jgi:hypothetical protein
MLLVPAAGCSGVFWHALYSRCMPVGTSIQSSRPITPTTGANYSTPTLATRSAIGRTNSLWTSPAASRGCDCCPGCALQRIRESAAPPRLASDGAAL